jgi:Tfp pilus assembly protein PilO
LDFDVKAIVAQIKDARNKNALVIGAAAAVILLVDIFLILLPLTALNFKLKAQIISIKKDAADLKKQATDISAIKSRLETVKNEQKTYEKQFPSQEEVPALLGGISAVAGKIGVEMVAVRPVKLEPGQKIAGADTIFQEVPVEIFAKGGYHQIGQFINRLESLDRFFEIKDIEIGTDKASPHKHFLKLLVSTYILKG